MTGMRFGTSRGKNPPGPFARFFFGRIFPLFFIASGGFAMFMGVSDLIRGHASERWPQAEARVVASAIGSHSGSKGGTTYSADIAYAYDVEGTRFVAKKVSFGEMSAGYDAAAETTRRYPEGKKVVVRYDPAEHSRAVLEPGLKASAFIPFAIGSVFLVAGVAMAIFLPRLMKKQAAAASEAPAAPGIPTGSELKKDHPKVRKEKGIAGTVYTTSGRNAVGWILLFIGLGQLAIVVPMIGSGKSAFPVLPIFLVADSVMLLGAAFILTSRYTVTVGERETGYRFGRGKLSFGKTVPVKHPMSVALENKGTEVNGRPVPALVVRNADGEEIAFGTLLDESRKTFLAGHIAKLLKAEKRAPENPFA